MLPVGVSLADVSERTYSEAQGPREAESSTIVGPVSSTRSCGVLDGRVGPLRSPLSAASVQHGGWPLQCCRPGPLQFPWKVLAVQSGGPDGPGGNGC